MKISLGLFHIQFLPEDPFHPILHTEPLMTKSVMLRGLIFMSVKIFQSSDFKGTAGLWRSNVLSECHSS